MVKIPECFPSMDMMPDAPSSLRLSRAQTTDRAGVLAGLQSVSSLDGTTDTYVFDRAGDTSLRWVSAMVVDHGAFKFVERLNVPQP